MATHCKIHPNVAPVCPACFAAKGGAATAGISSKAKAKASASNGRLGGRPKLAPHSPTAHKTFGDPGVTKRVPQCAGCTARLAPRMSRP